MSETQQHTDTPANPDAPEDRPLTFRIHRVSQLFVFALLIGASPIGLAAPWLAPIFLLPLLLAVWIERTRTVVDGSGVTVRRMWHSTRFSWDDVRSFRLANTRWLRAVLHSGREIQMPAVRVHDLPQLAALSGGRLPDPTAKPAEESVEESEATESADAESEDVPSEATGFETEATDSERDQSKAASE